MRGVILALLIGTICFALPGGGLSEVKMTGGGQYRDRKGIHVRAYSTFPSLVQLADGTLLCYDMSSRDGGRTWSRYQDFGFPLTDATRPCRGTITTLRDGTVLVVGRYTRKHERDSDLYVAEIYRSRNHFVGYAGPKRALIHILDLAAGTDEYGMPVSGPFFEGSIVELSDGDLVACMWGWFDSDQTPSGYPDRREKWQLKKCRTLLVRSRDRGDTWHYVATIAANPDAGPEGFRLPDLGLLPGGELLCLMRNGDGDTPLWLSRSRGDYSHWETPEKIAAPAVYGELLVLFDGTVLLVYGKPLYVMASSDGGKTWDSRNKMNVGTRTGQAFTGRATMVEVSPGQVVCVYNDVLDLHARVLTVTSE